MYIKNIKIMILEKMLNKKKTNRSKYIWEFKNCTFIFVINYNFDFTLITERAQRTAVQIIALILVKVVLLISPIKYHNKYFEHLTRIAKI
ncbi:hypothetical protein V1478_002004 [Vespula squamosa]|uniref:Uncharacterized protein n=1 Tax=Vespula squamosa TaxID=30214 RepID=A0ABD2BYQ9_VESSQ